VAHSLTRRVSLGTDLGEYNCRNIARTGQSSAGSHHVSLGQTLHLGIKSCICQTIFADNGVISDGIVFLNTDSIPLRVSVYSSGLPMFGSDGG
jgi:hypothetical protein